MTDNEKLLGGLDREGGRMNEEFEKWLSDNEVSNTTIWLNIARLAFFAGAAAMREKAAEVAVRSAGYMSFPPECCQEDYENHYAAVDIAAAIRKLEVE